VAKVRALILVAKDWRERAFIRAELIEEGIRTLAVEDMDEAEKWLKDPEIVPMIIVYDTKYQENVRDDINRLLKYSSSVPVLIIAGASEKKALGTELGKLYVVSRPITIGEVVRKVKEILRKGI
jgi:DNA-binding response OmpR family regulator